MTTIHEIGGSARDARLIHPRGGEASHHSRTPRGDGFTNDAAAILLPADRICRAGVPDAPRHQSRARRVMRAITSLLTAPGLRVRGLFRGVDRRQRDYVQLLAAREIAIAKAETAWPRQVKEGYLAEVRRLTHAILRFEAAN